MTSRSDCEPLPKPTLSPFALARPGTFLRVGFFTAAVWCVPALRVPLVHSLINHFRKKKKPTRRDAMTMDPDTLLLTICGPLTGRVPVLDSPCVVGVFHSHAVGLRGAPYQTQQPCHMARNHSPCTVLSAHTGRAASCSVSARIAQRRVELAAARLLPSSESPTLPEDSLRTAGATRTLWTGTSPMRPHTPGTRAPAPQTSQGPDTPWRPTCGSGQSPDAARAPSRHFTQEKREARSCNSKSGRREALTINLWWWCLY